MLNGTETRSPLLINSTPLPHSITSPVISCPRTSPRGAVVRPRTNVLVAAADVGRDGLDDDPVVDFPSLRRLQVGVVDALYLDFAWPEINHSMIGSHEIFSFLYCRADQTLRVTSA